MGARRTDIEAKSMPDSLEAELRTDERRAAFFEYVETHTLAQAAEHLRKKFRLTRDKSVIGRWAGERRAREAFSERLVVLRQSVGKGKDIAKAVGNQGQLTEANVALLQTALLEALLRGSAKERKIATQTLFFALQAIAKNKQADAQMLTAKTSHEKFMVDTAKLALKHAAELQQIHKGGGTEREKVEKAIAIVFGQRPKEPTK